MNPFLAVALAATLRPILNLLTYCLLLEQRTGSMSATGGEC